MFQQQANDGQLAAAGGIVQWRPAGLVDVCAFFDQLGNVSTLPLMAASINGLSPLLLSVLTSVLGQLIKTSTAFMDSEASAV
jgi:hypothetical protein